MTPRWRWLTPAVAAHPRGATTCQNPSFSPAMMLLCLVRGVHWTAGNRSTRKLAFRPVRQSKRSCSADGTITVWAAPSWDCLKTLAGHRSEVTGLAVHPSGRMALSTSR